MEIKSFRELIDLAQQGGFVLTEGKHIIESYPFREYDQGAILLDKNFWMGLGNQQKWKWPLDSETSEEIIVDPSEYFSQKKWLHHWHEFIDHIAAELPVAEFFETLLN